MSALQHEITATQVALFQQTGRLLEAADQVRRERDTLVKLLRQAEQTRKPTTKREGRDDR